MEALPTGTLTFLFTDLVGSTRLWEDHGDVMRKALARHDEILREAIQANGGFVVKTTGDGVHAAFASPADAIHGAIAAQRVLSEESWSAPEPLHVRMGMHTGVAELRDGDYYGPSLNRAARLMAAAHGGQIVVSLATEELARDELRDGIELVDLGEHQLRDLARPERVFQVAHPALGREFPALRTEARVPGNLVVPVTNLVGRDRDTTSVVQLLADNPMVTLIGVGGVGKTRLALHVAATVAADFPDGAWFCDLASVTSDDLVAPAVAGVVGAGVTTGRSPTEVVVDFLRAKRMLVVLDNCEHLVEAAGSLAAEILASCGRVRLLVTSREALAVDGERLWPVRPLPVPAADAGIEEASAVPTVELFVDRVRGFRPDFDLDPVNLRAVVDICRRLDGIPLALELAAARARSMSPSDIAARLDHRFGLLTGGRRRAVARHETLRAAVDWSYDLLDEAEREVLQRSSVFVGGFSLDATASVVGELVDDDVVDEVESLVDKSLLVADDEDGTMRYRMLETIRQYALERLELAGAADDARDRHAGYFVEFIDRASAGLLTAEELRWAARTEVELDNIRAATAWAAQTGQTDLALRLGTGLSAQVYLRQKWEAGHLADLAATVEGAADHELYPLALACVSDTESRRGNFERSRHLAETAIAKVGGTDTRAYWLAETTLGTRAMMVSDDEGVPHLERALASAKRGGTPYDVLLCQQFLAMALPSAGPEHLDRALAEAEEVLRLASELGSPSVLGQAHLALGYVQAMRGDPSAVHWLKLASKEALSGAALSGILAMLALALMSAGDLAGALSAVGRALQTDLRNGEFGMTANSLEFCAAILIRCDDLDAAALLVGVLEGDQIPHLVRAGVPADRRRRMVTRLTERLGPESFATAQTRGSAMSLDEATEFALERIAYHRARLGHGPASDPEARP